MTNLKNRLNDMTKKRSFRSALALLALLFAVCATLCACSDTRSPDDVAEREIYLTSQIVFSSPEEDTAYVYVSFSGSGERVGVATWSSATQNDGIWYEQSKSTFTLDASAIFSAVESATPQEDLENESHIYNHLKVILRYDTIYKSIKSDGEVSRNGRTYTHLFTLDETAGSQSFELTMRRARSENWYSALIAGGIVVFCAGIGIFLACKGKLCRKKKTRE